MAQESERKPRVERLINLLALLLNRRAPVTADEIRERVEGYDQPNLAAFRKMFERDKADLRELGIPISTVPVPGAAEGVEGYTIRPEDYRLPDPDLTPDERAALGLAMRVVRFTTGPMSAEDPRYVELKLGLPLAESSEVPPAFAEIDAADERVNDLLGAISEKREVSFDYTTAGGANSRRRVEPMAIASVGGRWYVAGDDLDRGAQRLFRVDRMGAGIELGPAGAFTVEDRPDIGELLSAGPWAFGSDDFEVEIRFHPDSAWRARALFGERAEYSDEPDGVHVRLRASDPELLIDSLLPFGTAAEILSPVEVRTRLIEHLRAIA